MNASDYSPGPFAANSVLSLFGTNLSWSTEVWSGTGSGLDIGLGDTAVFVDNSPVVVLYASSSQVNFILPSNVTDSTPRIRLTRDGVTGPEVTISLVTAAPALFDDGSGFAIATHALGALLTAAAPAQPGEIIVVYATGLGMTIPNAIPGQPLQIAAPIAALSSLAVSLDGVALPATSIQYAGVTPGSLGLYQINIQLPQDVGANPTIQVTVAGESSAGTLQLAVQ